MKLQHKIHLYTSGVFAILLFLISLAIYFTFSNVTYNSELNSAEMNASNTAAGMISSAGLIPEEDLLRAFGPLNGAASIVTNDSASLGTAISAGQNELRNTEKTFYNNQLAEIVDLDHGKYTFVSIPVIWTDGSVVNLQMYESIDTAVSNLQVLRNTLAGVMILALIPVFISGRLLGNVIMGPIRAMTGTMKEIQKSGEFKRIPLEEKSKDELYEMGDSFNHMMNLLETNYEKQEQFVANASHELKTPLTVIESYASLIKRRGIDNPEVVGESVEAIHSEAIRMKDLTQQLLLLAKHGEQWKLSIEEFDIKYLLEESVQGFRNAYRREIVFEAEESIVASADKQKLKQLIYILMDNAIKYSKQEIKVKLNTEGQQGKITVEDKGIGIPEDDLPKVFDRFYRVDKARTRASGGSGLGLSLAKELSEALGMEISLQSTEGKGTTASILFQINF
ncbi:sensor histidine kinase [Jeotgalibacillus salarius]|uniref:histidine kinase n=1 Tax=Jeotgalibacillus salarius TaxID=546023 RepID=A0A4Y8LCH0_9BACL|nr:HAMP domain-containing sensor histidine kinase [Jeotgalibacillus salarius]TFE00360.1 HAMP domain-containing histidine kinase [Jeotgalibacillus salarius]